MSVRDGLCFREMSWKMYRETIWSFHPSWQHCSFLVCHHGISSQNLEALQLNMFWLMSESRSDQTPVKCWRLKVEQPDFNRSQLSPSLDSHQSANIRKSSNSNRMIRGKMTRTWIESEVAWLVRDSNRNWFELWTVTRTWFEPTSIRFIPPWLGFDIILKFNTCEVTELRCSLLIEGPQVQLSAVKSIAEAAQT